MNTTVKRSHKFLNYLDGQAFGLVVLGLLLALAGCNKLKTKTGNDTITDADRIYAHSVFSALQKEGYQLDTEANLKDVTIQGTFMQAVDSNKIYLTDVSVFAPAATSTMRGVRAPQAAPPARSFPSLLCVGCQVPDGSTGKSVTLTMRGSSPLLSSSNAPPVLCPACGPAVSSSTLAANSTQQGGSRGGSGSTTNNNNTSQSTAACGGSTSGRCPTNQTCTYLPTVNQYYCSSITCDPACADGEQCAATYSGRGSTYNFSCVPVCTGCTRLQGSPSSGFSCETTCTNGQSCVEYPTGEAFCSSCDSNPGQSLCSIFNGQETCCNDSSETCSRPQGSDRNMCCPSRATACRSCAHDCRAVQNSGSCPSYECIDCNHADHPGCPSGTFCGGTGDCVNCPPAPSTCLQPYVIGNSPINGCPVYGCCQSGCDPACDPDTHSCQPSGVDSATGCNLSACVENEPPPGDCMDGDTKPNAGSAFCFDVCQNGTWVADTSCIPGCTDANATNYNASATMDDGSCTFNCMEGDSRANGTRPLCMDTCQNGNWVEDTSCIPGCTDANATNYNASATMDDGSCTFNCMEGDSRPNATRAMCMDTCQNGNWVVDTSCIPGCTDASATNYNASATIDDGSCLTPTPDPSADPDPSPSVCSNVAGSSSRCPGCCLDTHVCSTYYGPWQCIPQGTY